MNSVWAIRCVMIAIGAAIAVVLIVRGNVLIGALVGALVVTRAALLVAMFRRRREFRRRFGARQPGRS